MTHLRSASVALLFLAACQGTPKETAGPAPVSPQAAAASSASKGAGAEVTALADEYWTGFIQTFPLAALFLGVPDTPSDRMGDNSLAALRAWEQKENRWLARLRRVRAGSLRGQPEDATYGVLLETLEASQQNRVCRNELLPLNQQGGWQIGLPVMAQLQPLGNRQAPELGASSLARGRPIRGY